MRLECCTRKGDTAAVWRGGGRAMSCWRICVGALLCCRGVTAFDYFARHAPCRLCSLKYSSYHRSNGDSVACVCLGRYARVLRTARRQHRTVPKYKCPLFHAVVQTCR